MYLKMMSGEDAPDSDSRKTFELFDNVLKVKFGRMLSVSEAKKPEHRLVANQGPFVEVWFETGPYEKFWPEGNCYLMNNDGETIASFGVHPYVKHRERD